VTNREAKLLGDALVEKWEDLAHAATGDKSISWQPYTSEIMYECWGQTTRDHHCLDPKHPWPDAGVDFEELRQEAAEWVMEHYEDICDESV
jgi:hypothetical protein